MHIRMAHYEDFKRFVTGVGVAPPPAFDPLTGKPMPGTVPAPVVDPAAPPTAPVKPAPAPKAGPKMAGAVYDWGGTPGNPWECILVSTDFHNVVSSRALDGLEPKTFAVDFPDAVTLDGRLDIV